MIRLGEVAMSKEQITKQQSSLSRVLVVDDEVLLVKALCIQLQTQGYAAVGLTSGAEALTALREQEFEVLLCDLMMPGMDGIALLKAGLEVDANLVGVVMTGQGTVESAVEAMKQGACDYLLKPFKMAELLSVLSKALELRRLRLENLDLRQTLGLYELTNTLRLAQDLNLILDKTIEVVLQQTGVDEASIMLPTQDGKELFVAAVRGGQQEHLLGRRVPLEGGVAGWVARHREPLALEGSVQDERFGDCPPRAEVGTSLSLPMLAAGQLVGVLNLNDNTRRRPFTPGEVKILHLLTGMAAEALEASRSSQQFYEVEAQYQAIFDNAVVGIFQATSEGRFLKANLAQARMLGYDAPEELIAAISDTGSQVYISGEGREELRRQLAARGMVRGLEIEARRKDGSTLWVLMSARTIRDAAGAIRYYEGIVEDITARKRQELEEKAVQQVREEVWRMQSAEQIAEVLERLMEALEALKIPFQDCAVNVVERKGPPMVWGYNITRDRQWHDWGGDEEPDEAICFIHEFCRGGKYVYRPDLEREDPYRERDKLARFYGSPRRSVIDVPFSHGTLAINSDRPNAFSEEDITFLKKLAEVLSEGFKRQEDLKKLNEIQQQFYQSQKLESLGQLAGGVAHDFNNLITVIDGYSHMALKQLPQEDSLLRSAVEEVQRAGERAEALVRQLLAFSRRQRSERQTIDLNQVVSGVQKMLGRLIGEDVELRVKLAPAVGTMEADPGQLEQVLMNLVVNARDAMPQGGQLTIETALCQVDELAASSLGLEGAGQYCRLSVHDTGVGMSAEVQQHIFEPFFTTKAAGKGTGLGLATVYGIIKEHRGGIQLRSEQGKGTSFELYLPGGASGEKGQDQQQRQPALPPGGETILLVEDDGRLRQMIYRNLGELGYTVLEADRGDTALQACSRHPQTIALLLTDVVLPGVNGYALAAQVRALRPGMKVLYMSGYAERGGLPQGEGVHFLSKPFTANCLARAVRQTLDSAPPN